MDHLAIFHPLSNPRWGPSSLARTLPGTLLHRRRSPRVLGGVRPVPVCPDPPVMLLLALLGHLLSNSLPVPDLKPYELFTQFQYLFEVKDHFLTPGFVGVFYLFHHQLGITAYLQLISFYGVARLSPAMTASYSASLLEAWNPNMRAYSTSILFGEVRIRPTPLPWELAASSMDNL